jgi:hypothetical protein
MEPLLLLAYAISLFSYLENVFVNPFALVVASKPPCLAAQIAQYYFSSTEEFFLPEIAFPSTYATTCLNKYFDSSQRWVSVLFEKDPNEPISSVPYTLADLALALEVPKEVSPPAAILSETPLSPPSSPSSPSWFFLPGHIYDVQQLKHVVTAGSQPSQRRALLISWAIAIFLVNVLLLCACLIRLRLNGTTLKGPLRKPYDLINRRWLALLERKRQARLEDQRRLEEPARALANVTSENESLKSANCSLNSEIASLKE